MAVSGMLRSAGLYALILLPVGFVLGTLTLIGPVRWITSTLRARNAPERAETVVVLALICLLLLVTFAIAWFVYERLVEGSTLQRSVLAGTLIVIGGATWILWLDPDVMAGLGGGLGESAASTAFTFGPYPDESALRRLKAEGYTGVVTLLHPAVVPFEPQLLSREREAAERVGIPLIHLPMLPWVSSNEKSLQALESLARDSSGRYYVHCYLGKDRVLMARRVIERHAPEDAVLAGITTGRSIDEKGHFERGRLDRLSSKVVVGPLPTDEEFSGFITNGTFEHVVTLMDPDDADDLRRISHERSFLQPLGISLTVAPIRPESAESDARAAARAVNGLEGATYVHGFFGSDRDKGWTTRAFIQAFARPAGSGVQASSVVPTE